MQATMTCAGLDVHARSTHAAAIDVVSGELRRVRFGGDADEVVGWLAGLKRTPALKAASWGWQTPVSSD
jgi:hypothetical protein